MKLKYYIEAVHKEKEIENLQESIINFFMHNEVNKDNIFQLSENLHISIDEINLYLYDVLNSFLNVGKFKESGMRIDDIDPIQLRKGIIIEMEHTTNKFISKKIALDHLAEIPNYYTQLEKLKI